MGRTWTFVILFICIAALAGWLLMSGQETVVTLPATTPAVSVAPSGPAQVQPAPAGPDAMPEPGIPEEAGSASLPGTGFAGEAGTSFEESTGTEPSRIQGIVENVQGAPVQGAEVLFFARDADWTPTGSATTSATGSFSLEASGGSLAVLVSADTYARGGILTEATAPSVRVTLAPEKTIQGRVYENFSGKAVADATVAVRPLEGGDPVQILWSRVRPAQAVSDAEGKYILSRLDAGLTLNLRCTSEYHLPVDRPGIRAGATGVDFVLDRGGIVKGVAMAEDSGNPVPGARVKIWTEESLEGFPRETDTGADGTFALNGLPFREYRVRADAGEIASHGRPEQGMVTEVSPDEPEREIILLLKAWPVGSLSGTVRDTENVGVRDAVVEVRELPDGGVRFRAETDANGRYRIDKIHGGDYRVVPKASGLYTAERGLRMRDGEVRENFDFVMITGYLISGLVTLEDGKTGVPDVRVRAARQRRDPSPAVTTEGDGTFVYGPVPTGDYVLEADPTDAYTVKEGVRQVSVEDRDVEGVHFLVTQGGSISGIVTSENGPVPQARVGLATSLETPNTIETYDSSVRTDAAGRYTLEGIPEGMVYAVSVQADGYASHLSAKETMRKPEPVTHPEIRLDSPGARITGTVRMANGSAPPPVTLEAQLADREEYRRTRSWGMPRSDREARVGSDGRFEITGLSAGAWEVSVRATRALRAEPQTVELSSNVTAEIEFVLGSENTGTASISGWVRNSDGSPATGYQIRTVAFREREFYSVPVNADGSFLVSGLTEGREYRVEASPGTTNPWERSVGPSRNVTAPADGIEFLIEAGGSITGSVTDLGGGAVRNYEIQVEQERSGWGRGGPGFSSTADTMPGRYIARNLQPGRYRIAGYAPERAPAYSEWVDVEAGRITDGVDIVFDPGAVLRGQVLEEDTEDPVAGALVFTRSGGWSRDIPADTVERTAYTNSEGRFALEHLPRGNVWLVVSHGSYAARFEREIPVPEAGNPEELTIHLTLGGSIEGTLLDLAGAGIPNQQIRVERRWNEYSAVTDPSGNFRVNKLPEGEYRVNWRGIHEEVEVKTGDTASVVLQEREPENN